MTNKISPQQLEEYKMAFSLFDENGDGSISSIEIEQVMQKMGYKPTKEEVNDMLNELDVDQNGTIDFNEFITLMSKQSKPKDEDEELREAFKVFDKDGSGNISSIELKQVMITLGEKMTDDDIAAMIKGADIDGDGQISFTEFLKMMKGDKK